MKASTIGLEPSIMLLVALAQVLQNHSTRNNICEGIMTPNQTLSPDFEKKQLFDRNIIETTSDPDHTDLRQRTRQYHEYSLAEERAFTVPACTTLSVPWTHLAVTLCMAYGSTPGRYPTISTPKLEPPVLGSSPAFEAAVDPSKSTGKAHAHVGSRNEWMNKFSGIAEHLVCIAVVLMLAAGCILYTSNHDRLLE
jgi:hypothetical protein